MSDSELIGSVIDGRYKITRVLGAGAMGCVYEAEQADTGRRVAIKLINVADFNKNPSLVARFQREAKTASAIETQHITQMFDTGTDRESGLPFMAMELLVGEDLQQLLGRIGPLAPDLALRVVAQACIGLQKAHDAHVVHRDIKPANIFLTRRDSGEYLVKVLDFGIAKVKMDHANETENAGLTRTGNMLGSPLYMSPEQARGTRQIDHRADIWSLGVVLYQLLTGRTPYQHIQALGELIIAICHDAPPHIQDFAPWVPPEIAAIAHRAIRQAPNERYESASAMLEAIKPHLKDGSSITEAMLVPLTAEMKSHVAGRLTLTSLIENMATVEQSQANNRGPVAVRVSSPDLGAHAASAPDFAARPSMTDSANTPSAMVQSQAPMDRPSSRAPLAVGMLVAAALAGGGVYAVTRPSAGPEVGHVQAQAAPPLPPPAPSPPPAVVSASTSAEAATPAPAPRRVKLVIVPTDASVEVEGAAVTASNGIVEIMGAPGSVHRVRLFKGKSETITDVIITESGPAPPKVELKPTVMKKAAADASASVTKKPPPGISNKFE